MANQRPALCFGVMTRALQFVNARYYMHPTETWSKQCMVVTAGDNEDCLHDDMSLTLSGKLYNEQGTNSLRLAPW
jgi:hypothetical protein